MPDTPALLARVPLLRDLQPQDLEHLAATARQQQVRSGDTIVEIGDPARSLYLLVDGQVQVVYPSASADFELARLGPGDFFGEMALLNDKPGTATVRALSEATLLILNKMDFRRVVSESPELAMNLLSTLSGRVRTADEHVNDLSDQAVHDALTGLLNRRAFHDRIAQEVARTRRYGTSFSLIILDLDHFTQINDTLGHAMGDRVLAWIGRILQEHIRAADVPFRIGGEEFAVLCPTTGPAMARNAAERLVSVVSEAVPPIEQGLNITMSAGYAACPLHGTSFEDLYYVAEQALLRAKELGRNQVIDPGVARP
ncbi:MAG TPA: GGDEF domain-containing protein [Longimicrobiales bacterium]|nr:GGDEF domain-containing protein [Longimicrobiales bacterium]